ncbi:MAG: hypothetical protein AB7I57_22865 [Pirellulales bacterium]
MDAQQSPQAAAIAVAKVFPPQTIGAEVAEQIVAFRHARIDPQDVARLAREPQQRDSFALVGSIGDRVIVYVKLQHGGPGDVWIRSLVIDEAAGLEAARVVFGELRQLLGYHEDLVALVGETDLRSQLELRELGLECQPLHQRSKPQIKHRHYVFRSWRPPQIVFAGQARFTWPW